MELRNFYSRKRVLLTGHTGFKGTWLTKILLSFGAEVCGYSLEAPTNPNLFELSDVISDKHFHNNIGDMRDIEHLKSVFEAFKPEIVFHLAAQPIVRDSYKDPVGTYSTNVMGTVNILECIRTIPCVKSFLNITTDKVYKNNEWYWGYRENEPLDGRDPYSNSKSCSELVTHSYKDSFFSDGGVRISTARAGNVIGGGDFANDRIIPDCVRAVVEGKDIVVRNPNSIRPYQHVLEPLSAYLMIAAKQYEDKEYASYYNVGPNEDDCLTTGQIADLFVQYWKDGASWTYQGDNGFFESNYLKLDCSKIKSILGWKPKWSASDAVKKTVDWYKEWAIEGDIVAMMNQQIVYYFD